MQDIFGLDHRKSEPSHSPAESFSHKLTLRFYNTLVAGASKWQAAAFQLGLVLSAVGLIVMLLTYLKSFGAAELLGQVYSYPMLEALALLQRCSC